MKWNDEKGYITYSSVLQSLKSFLGISQVDFMLRCELSPYVTYILQYINSRLILLGEDVGIKVYLQEVFDIYEAGSNKIINNAAKELAFELCIDTNEDVCPTSEEIPYNQDRFIFAWTNILTSLVVRLKFQYSSLLVQPIDTSCPCDECGNTKGQTTEDFEAWKSGVFPEDESYSWYNFSDDGTTWRITNSIPECTKCSRRY